MKVFRKTPYAVEVFQIGYELLLPPPLLARLGEKNLLISVYPDGKVVLKRLGSHLRIEGVIGDWLVFDAEIQLLSREKLAEHYTIPAEEA